MKHIGFIDYYIDEWHANNYPEWIRKDIADYKREYSLSYVWADIEKKGKLTTSEWCKKHQVSNLSSIEELVEKSDFIVVLSPDDPKEHERLSDLALKSGKPVYIDKTFSYDLDSGIRMFKLAEEYDTPMFSSSALRFSTELSKYPNDDVNPETIEFISSIGPGDYDSYSIHQIEVIVLLMGIDVLRIKRLGTKNGRLFVIEYEDGRQASLLQMPKAPFRLSIQLNNKDGVFLNSYSDMFPRFIHEMLDFFETKKVPVEKEQTLAIMAIREAGQKVLDKHDEWIRIRSY